MITIDALPSTSQPSLEHEVAAMRNGATVKLTVAQIKKSVLAERKETLAEAIADTPETSPEYYILNFFNETRQSGSGARWRKTVEDVSALIAVGAAFKNHNGTGVSYVNDATWLKPQQFGEIGVDPAGDTSAWKALIAAANYREGKVKVDITQDLSLNGTIASIDDQTFTNFDSIWVRGSSVSIFQRQALAKTLKLVPSDPSAKPVGKVTGVKFVGYAEQEINASGVLTEIDFDSSSENGVAGIYAEDLYELKVKRISSRNHAGKDIDCWGVLHLKGRDLDLTGVGPDYNRPILDGHQGNGVDAAIQHLPKIDTVGGQNYYIPETTNAWRQTLDVCNSRIKWHSFCIRTILNAAVILHGNYFGETPGQHHIYDTDSDGHSVIGNIFEGCRQIGYKMQFENLAGFNLGPLWAEGVSYEVGDVVRFSSISWICTIAHTSGASFNSGNFAQHSRYIRRGGVWTGNHFLDCGVGVGIIESSAVNGYNIWSEGYVVDANTFKNCETSIYGDRMWKASITNNSIQGGTYGFYGRSFSGNMAGNFFHDTAKNCILIIGLAKTSTISNQYCNYGSMGANDSEKSAVLIAPHHSEAPPAASDTPRVMFKTNGFFHYNTGAAADTADAPGLFLVECTDASSVWEITDTYGTPTTKRFKIEGTVSQQYNNHFPGYYNTTQDPRVSETGSNANGTFIKWSNGVLECYTNVSIAVDASSMFTDSDLQTWPVSFTDTPVIMASAASNYGDALANAASVSGTSTNFIARALNQYNTANTAGTCTVSLRAIGRWY